MALNQKQLNWIGGFVAVADSQNAHDEDEVLRQLHLGRMRKAFESFRAEYRSAFQIAVSGQKGKAGNLLEVDGTQMDEADMADYVAGLQKDQSAAATELVHKASSFITKWTESLKSVQSSTGGRLFTDQDIADELYTPLVRERMVPETVVGDFYSETQTMIDRTNALYVAGVADRDELTPEFDRGKAVLGLVGGLASAGASFVADSGMAEWAGVDPEKVKLAQDIMSGVSMASDVGQDLNDLIRNSGFPDAADSLVDNIGNLLGHVVGMVTEDKSLGEQIGNAYKGASGVAKAGIYFSQGDVDGGLAALASGLESSVKAGDPSGKNDDLAKGAKGVAMALRAGGSGWKVAEAVRNGDAGGAVDAITNGVKSAMKDSFEISGTSETDEAGHATQGVEWAGVAIQTGIKVYEAKKAKDIASGISAILGAVQDNLTDILTTAGVDERKAKQVGNGFKAAVSGTDVIAALVQDPPDVETAMEKLGSGIESSFKAADADNEELQKAGGLLSSAFTASGSQVKLGQLYAQQPIDHQKVAQQFEKVMKSLAKYVLGFAPEDEDEPEEETEEEEALEDAPDDGDEEEEDKEDPFAEILEGFTLDLGESAGKLNELDEAELERRQQEAAERESLEAARGDQGPGEMIRLMEESSRGELSASDAARIDTLIRKMIKDRMIIDTALKIAQGGASVAAKFVPAMSAAGNAIKLAANIMAAAERGRDLYHWKKNTKDFSMAQNMLSAASQNFVRNQAEQFSYYTIQAAFEAAQLIGELAGATGIASAAGKAVVAAAEAAKTCQDLVRDYARKEDLESAWKMTCKAFNNPTNRKLALQARSMNPTLAKYCIAWGAYEKKDPLARNAVRAINLTESSLEHEATDVQKVVEYMEVYFRDDLSLYREIELYGDWLKGLDIAISMRSWSTIKARAVKSAQLESTDTAQIDALLSDVQGVVEGTGKSTLDDAIDELASIESTEFLVGVLSRLGSAFRSYRPACSSDGAEVFKGVTRNLSDQCRNFEAAAQRKIQTLRELAALPVGAAE